MIAFTRWWWTTRCWTCVGACCVVIAARQRVGILQTLFCLQLASAFAVFVALLQTSTDCLVFVHACLLYFIDPVLDDVALPQLPPRDVKD
jgi:hypothetical protein